MKTLLTKATLGPACHKQSMQQDAKSCGNLSWW